MRIIKYPHPTLRHKSKPLQRVDAELKKIVAEMFALMYEQKGIGLAANQVDLPYRFFILNLENDPAKAPEHVFLNPVISRRTGTAEAEEGCLSFPDMYAPVKRSAKVTISAYDLQGREINYQLDGLFARAVQHEYDHLEGILFIDRLSPAAKMTVQPALDDLERVFYGDRQRGFIPEDGEIVSRLAELEALRT
ncbi:MAG: peptide deformylase [Pirellulales bacterium]|nr:peptide deformylase [Pirellulales bacterium]